MPKISIIPSKNDLRKSHAELAAELNIPLEWLRNGFRLAHFIVLHRETALQILAAAISRLKKEYDREKKRVYWRQAALKRKLTAVVRDRGDVLQWLILCEATAYEIKQERGNSLHMADMIVRYLKYLIQITTPRSSIYVSVAVQRLIYKYSTPDTRRSYEWATPHRPKASAYRAIKGFLMGQVMHRFGGQLRVCDAVYGEQRFESLERKDEWRELVEHSLNLFTPWSTRKSCATSTSLQVRSGISARTNRSTALDTIEMRRCHAFIDPKCHRKLAKTLRLDPPWERLEIPKFLNTKRGGSNSFRRRYKDCPDITADELQELIKCAQKARR